MSIIKGKNQEAIFRAKAGDCLVGVCDYRSGCTDIGCDILEQGQYKIYETYG
ncbi:MAG: hypothetical protein LUC25_00235 [Ruminococcus sp.]|nr:hypothetical protein [Ruminococcus sp.]